VVADQDPQRDPTRWPDLPHLDSRLDLTTHSSGSHLAAVTLVHGHWQGLTSQGRLVNLQAAVVDQAV
jgi:hypothetical protein